MLRNKIFYSVCSGFAAGIFWRSFLKVDLSSAFLVGLVSIFLILFFSLAWKKKRIALFFVFTLAFSLGILRFHLADKPPPEVFERQIGQKVFLSGIIVDYPDEKENNVNLVAETKLSGQKTRIILAAKENNDYRYGDEINFSGKLEKPKNFLTDQGKKFDYVNYLRKDSVIYAIQNPKIEALSRGHGNFIKRALFSAKKTFSAAINSTLPAPESILMEGLTLGERSSFSQSLRQSFINTGTIHIVAVSGYNVTLVAEWIMKILAFLPMFFATGAGIAAIFIYVAITGGTQTAIRAGIMATLALLARATGRVYGIGRALILAAVIMIIINPFILAFDVSFQLSFLATIAVIFLAPKIEEYFLWIKRKWLRDIVSVTSAAYMFVLPFILYKMGNLSLVALPANIAILPFVPATMILGFITGLAGVVSNILAFVPGIIAYALLYYELAAIGFFADFSFSSLSIPNFPLILVILIYAIFFRILFWKNEAKETAPNVNFFRITNFRFLVLTTPFFITLVAAGFLYYHRYESNQIADRQMQALLRNIPASNTLSSFVAGARTKTSGCVANGPLPDPLCTPGAVFEDATPEQICVSGYTKTVRNVSTKLRKQVYAEYGVAYPQPRGAYEVDHLIPLAIGGSNDIANLFLEAAEPAPGFREKDVVEVYLQQEVCARRVDLSTAQKQIATDWTAIYDKLTPEQILAIKKKYGNRVIR